MSTESKLRSTAPAPAANQEPGLPPGTTLFDVIAALQDAADEYFNEDGDAADQAVCASLVELRHRLSAQEQEQISKVA